MILYAAPPFRAPAEPSPPIPLAWRAGLLCVPVAVGGAKPLWFLLDTGAHRSFVSHRARERLIASGVRVGTDGTMVVKDARIGSYPVPALRLDDEGTENRNGLDLPVDGYLGVDFLRWYRVGLDLREKTLRLWPAERTAEGWFTLPPEELVQVPLRERPEGWCVPVEVGNLTVPMVFDTGASATFLHTEVAALLKGAKKAKRDAGDFPFYDGVHRVRTYLVPQVGLGDVSFGERAISVASVPQMVGLLGRDLIAPLKVLLDYPGGKAVFAGMEGLRLSTQDGPGVTLASGVVVHWPRGVVVKAPAGCAYTLPPGYREVLNGDESVDLVPPKPI